MPTLHDFLEGWKDEWDEHSGLSTVNGPYSDQEPPSATPEFPYVVVTATSTLDGMDNVNERYRVIVDVSVYHSTKTLAASVMNDICDAFTVENLFALPAGKGSVIRARRVSDVPSQEMGERQVWRHRCTWNYLWVVARP